METFAYVLAVCTALGLAAAAWLTLRPRRPRSSPGLLDVHDMRERDFESLVAAAFRAQGYEPITATKGASAAIAGELMMRRERTTFLVACRHFRAGRVDVDGVQAVQRAMAVRGASAGFVLTGGRFSREAIALAGTCGIRLVDGPALRAMLGRPTAP